MRRKIEKTREKLVRKRKIFLLHIKRVGEEVEKETRDGRKKEKAREIERAWIGKREKVIQVNNLGYSD